jgi:hypothetical protein
VPLNETQIRINDILSKGCYIIVGVDPTGKEKLKVHAVNVPIEFARKIMLALATDAARADDITKRDFLAAAAAFAQQLQDEERVTNEILRP